MKDKKQSVNSLLDMLTGRKPKDKTQSENPSHGILGSLKAL